MGHKTNRHSVPAKARSSTNKQTSKKNNTAAVKQAAKKKYFQRWSRDRSERVRDALNRDAGLLYNAFGNSSSVPSPVLQADSVAFLAESMQGLGRRRRDGSVRPRAR